MIKRRVTIAIYPAIEQSPEKEPEMKIRYSWNRFHFSTNKYFIT